MADSNRYPPSRRSTMQSYKTGRSTRRRNTDTNSAAEASASGRLQEEYSSYRLDWTTLRTFLQGKWSDFEFPEEGLQEFDHWLFEAPEKLSETDKEQIAALRDKVWKSSHPLRDPSPE